MKCIEYKIPYRPGELIRIKPIFDVHLYNRHCDVVAFKEFLADSGRNTYFVGGGDLFDSIVTTDPRFQKSAAMGNEDAALNEALDYATDLLYPYRNRIIGLGIGNHEANVLKRYNINLIRLLCEKLEGQSSRKPNAYPRSLGYSWGLTLRFRVPDKGAGRTLRIYGHHGFGGGSRTRGADITKYSRVMESWDADCYLFGHVHQLKTDRIRRLGFTNERIISKPKLLGICGTFLKTLSPTDEPTYSEQGGYPPTEIGGLTLCVKPQVGSVRQPIKYWFSDEED